MKIAVFGKGYLGGQMAAYLSGKGHDVVVLGTNITDPAAVAEALRKVKPEWVVNAAGKTGKPNVDACEAMPLETARSNVLGPIVLAEVCHVFGARLLHLGSGCVFYGHLKEFRPGGWREDDVANPQVVYTKTKYAADLALMSLPHVAIARLRMPIGGEPARGNLIAKLASYARVMRAENSVTFLPDLFEVCEQMMDRRAQGLFHVTNPGTLTHEQILAAYTKYVSPEHRYELVDESQLLIAGTLQKGRSTTVLDSSKLKKLGITMRPAEERLEEAMKEYGRALRASRAEANHLG